MAKKITYEQAMQRIEEIVQLAQDPALELEQLTKLLKEAQELLKNCRKRLTDTEEEVNRILDDFEQE